MKILTSVFAAAVITLVCNFTFAQPKSSSNSLDAKELERLLDPIFAEQMKKLHVPGAVVVLVQNGKILFLKGYGVADVEKQTPVIPDKTIFRIGSITKVFTATAVMQLADRKKIKLNDDVSKYLTGVKVPNTFAQPITFFNLLTHTSGLDDISPGRRTDDENKVVPLGEFLKTRIVRRLPPGEVISYGTYNPALAALAVEQITRTPFKIYLEKNIFEPLGMTRTSIAAVKGEYRPDLAVGYEYAENKYQPLPFQWFHTYPASDINSTATDMARFMIANLQRGAIDDKRILSRKAAQEMQATQFRSHPRISGWAYGFYEGTQNNLRFVEHGGNIDDGYSALMTLVPEKGLGIFVAGNTETGGTRVGEAVKKAFFNRYFPASAKPEVLQVKNASPDVLKKFAGKYRSNIYCHSCPPDSGTYVPNVLEAKVTGDGMLLFRGRRFKQIEPMLFVQVDGEKAGEVMLGFKENKQGEITYLTQHPLLVFEKVAP